MENNENITTLEDVTITEDEARAAGVSSLRDAPNRAGGFGHNSLTAEQLKQRFDKLPKLIIARLNALVSLVTSGEFAGKLVVKEEGKEAVPLLDYLSQLLGDAEAYADGAADKAAADAKAHAEAYADERVRDVLAIDPETLKLLLDLAGNFSETRGYYFKAIDLASKKIYLSHEQVKPVDITSAQHAAYYDADFQVSYKVGGKLGVVNNFEYSYGTSHVMDNLTWLPSAVIKGIDGNVITYEGDIGFGYIYGLSPSSWDSKDYSVYCLDEPDVGEVCLMVGGTILGEGNTIVGNLGFNAGKGNKVRGSYGVAVGRNLEVGYAAFATNFGNKALAHRSFASGSETQALAFASHTEGEGTIAKNVNGQHVEGYYNLPDEKGEYLHITGGGDKVYRNNKWEITRRNIHTINKTGRAWYADGVFVGGTSMHDAERLATEEYADKKSVDANIGERRSNKLFAFPANRIKLHALIDDVWTEVTDNNFYKLFTNGMQAYTGSDGKMTWRPFDNSANYLGADSAVPTAWRITLTNPVRGQGGDRYVHLNAACIRVPGGDSIDLRVVGRQLKGTEVTYISSFALSGGPSNNTRLFDNGAFALFGGWPNSVSTNLDTLYIYLTRDTSKALNKNFAIDQIHFFGRQTYVADLNMVNYDHAYKVGSNGKDVSFQGKIQAQPATEDNQLATLGQMNAAVDAAASEAVAEVVGSSKATLDTLEELGKALGEDPNFATTIANQLGEISERINDFNETFNEHKDRYIDLNHTVRTAIDKETSEEFGYTVVQMAAASMFSDYASCAENLSMHRGGTLALSDSGKAFAGLIVESHSVYLIINATKGSVATLYVGDMNSTPTKGWNSNVVACNGSLFVYTIHSDKCLYCRRITKIEDSGYTFAYQSEFAGDPIWFFKLAGLNN